MVHVVEVPKFESEGKALERLEKVRKHIAVADAAAGVVDEPTFRNYSNDAIQAKIRELYKAARENQTVSKVREMRRVYGAPDALTRRMTVWEALKSLETFVDVSDPDVELPNAVHLYQAAEWMRAKQMPDWLQLAAFIHDLGKCMYLKGDPADGTTMDTQWGIVGDTFVVGAAIPDSMVYPEFNPLNPDHARPEYAGEVGMYDEGCGLDQCLVSYGHDEYLYQVLSTNENVTLPREALYCIRYHSLYPWHKEGAYGRLESSYDRMMKGWVLLFNQCDLYTKRNEPYTAEQLAEMQAYYTSLIDKYMPGKLRW